MAETAAHLIEHVLPEQPIRQWVLSFPYALRFLFASRPAVLSKVLGIVYQAISTFLVRRAGLRVHAGAYAFDDEAPRLHRVAAPTQAELQRLLHAITVRVTRALERQGLLSRDEENPALDLEPDDGFEQLLGAAVHYRIATGPHAGRKALTLHTVSANPPTSNPCIAQLSGFSLHAGTRCRARDRDSLESSDLHPGTAALGPTIRRTSTACRWAGCTARFDPPRVRSTWRRSTQPQHHTRAELKLDLARARPRRSPRPRSLGRVRQLHEQGFGVFFVRLSLRLAKLAPPQVECAQRQPVRRTEIAAGLTRPIVPLDQLPPLRDAPDVSFHLPDS